MTDVLAVRAKTLEVDSIVHATGSVFPEVEFFTPAVELQWLTESTISLTAHAVFEKRSAFMSLQRLIYRSRSTQVLKHSTLKEILNVAIEYNRQHQITGLLSYARSYFFQCLEGSPESLGRLLGRIYRDQRHTDLVILDAREVSSRLFFRLGYETGHARRLADICDAVVY